MEGLREMTQNSVGAASVQTELRTEHLSIRAPTVRDLHCLVPTQCCVVHFSVADWFPLTLRDVSCFGLSQWHRRGSQCPVSQAVTSLTWWIIRIFLCLFLAYIFASCPTFSLSPLQIEIGRLHTQRNMLRAAVLIRLILALRAGSLSVGTSANCGDDNP